MPLLLIEESKNTNLIFIWSGLTDGRNHDLQTGNRGIRTAIPNSPIYELFGEKTYQLRLLFCFC
jgi:hypothetical protein